jgi:hypothetical protein
MRIANVFYGIALLPLITGVTLADDPRRQELKHRQNLTGSTIGLRRGSRNNPMNTSKLICGIAALTLLTDVAFAAPKDSTPTPVQASHASQPRRVSSSNVPDKQKRLMLANEQMDKVTAGGDVQLGAGIVTYWTGAEFHVEGVKTYGQALSAVCAAAKTTC